MLLRRTALLTLILLVWSFCATQVHAAEINAEGAQKLKAIFENILSYQRDTTRPEGAKLQYEGEVMVEQASTYYAVTLPHVRMLYPDGTRLDIGMVSINASPYDKPGQWKMAVAVPTPIVLLGTQQSQAIKINIGGQKTAGIWDENLENFAKLDAQYKDITVENPVSGFSLKIPESRILYDFANTPEGKWSGPGRIQLTNITAVLPGFANLKIAEATGDFVIDAYNPAILKTYRAFLKTYFQEMEKQTRAGTKPDAAKTKELADKLADLLMNSSNGFKGDYSVTGLDIGWPGPQGAPEQNLKVAKAYFGLGASGFLDKNVSLGLRAGYDGLTVMPVPPGYDGVFPTTSNIDVAVAKVPLQQLVEVSRNTLEGALERPEMAQLAGFSLLMKAPVILSQAGTYMDIKNNYIGNDQYRFEINGQAKADINAVNNVTAGLKGSFRGLDALMAKVKALAADPQRPGAKNAQNLMNSLEMLKAYGKPEPGPDGQPVYMYDFIMDPKGQMLMNGKPALGMGLTPKPAAPPAASPAP
jgi:hypothetical protein